MGKVTIPHRLPAEPPLHKGAFYSTTAGFILAPEGSNGEGRKSVKKNAALLRFLAFSFLDHIFGVLRGEQPLSRASRAIGSSGTLFGSFWGSKRNTYRKRPIIKGRHRKVVSPAKCKQKSNKHLRTSWRQLRHRWQRRGGCAPGGRGYPYFPLENPAKIVRPRKTRHSGNHLQIVLVTQ